MKRLAFFLATLLLGVDQIAFSQESQNLPVRLSWGHRSRSARPFSIRLRTNNVEATNFAARDFEVGDQVFENRWLTQAGGGDVDALEFELNFPARSIATITNLQRIWTDLIAQSDSDTARRFRQDPAYRPDDRLVTVEMNSEGTQGFSVTIDQLLRTGSFWIPQLDVYLTAGDAFQDFNDHQQQLRPFAGQGILEQVEQAPEASYRQFKALWEDMGNPAYKNPAQTGPGHVVCVTWDSAIPKFGIDRTGGVWNDNGNPDRLHSWIELGRGSEELEGAWKGQFLAQGLPVLTTVFQDGAVRYELEQFAYPLNGPPEKRSGEIAMVLLQQLSISNTVDRAVPFTVQWLQRRKLTEGTTARMQTNAAGAWIEDSKGSALFALQGGEHPPALRASAEGPRDTNWMQTELRFSSELSGHDSRRLIAKLPSPALAPADEVRLMALDYETARERTLAFWAEYLARGAQFRVPDPAVNELFRANLWHALRLPRRHGSGDGQVKLDLPYSNFAYGQKGAPWPVNQAVYVDYMLYGLRGYTGIATEELEAIYANNQEANGHVGGYANWVVYTPGMIYAVAQNYLLSGDEADLARLLPQTLRALDWCLAEIESNSTREGASRGLVRGPLNDLTGDGTGPLTRPTFTPPWTFWGGP